MIGAELRPQLDSQPTVLPHASFCTYVPDSQQGIPEKNKEERQHESPGSAVAVPWAHFALGAEGLETCCGHITAENIGTCTAVAVPSSQNLSMNIPPFINLSSALIPAKTASRADRHFSVAPRQHNMVLNCEPPPQNSTF